MARGSDLGCRLFQIVSSLDCPNRVFQEQEVEPLDTSDTILHKVKLWTDRVREDCQITWSRCWYLLAWTCIHLLDSWRRYNTSIPCRRLLHEDPYNSIEGIRPKLHVQAFQEAKTLLSAPHVSRMCCYHPLCLQDSLPTFSLHSLGSQRMLSLFSSWTRHDSRHPK